MLALRKIPASAKLTHGALRAQWKRNVHRCAAYNVTEPQTILEDFEGQNGNEIGPLVYIDHDRLGQAARPDMYILNKVFKKPYDYIEVSQRHVTQ